MVVGTAIPESRITAQPVLVNDLRQNVSIYDIIHTTLIVKLLYIMISYAWEFDTNRQCIPTPDSTKNYSLQGLFQDFAQGGQMLSTKIKAGSGLSTNYVI